jgi:hypothetical protein
LSGGRVVQKKQIGQEAKLFLDRRQAGMDGRKLIAEEGAERFEVRHAAPPYGELIV